MLTGPTYKENLNDIAYFIKIIFYLASIRMQQFNIRKSK